MPSTPISPSPRLAWRSTIASPSGVLRVDRRAARRAGRSPTTLSNSSITARQRLRGAAHVVARTRAGGRSPGRSPSQLCRRRSGLDQHRRPPRTSGPSVPAAPGGVLEQQRAAPRTSASASAMTSPARCERRSTGRLLSARARVQDHADARRSLRRRRFSATCQRRPSDFERISGSSDARVDAGRPRGSRTRLDDPGGLQRLVERRDRPRRRRPSACHARGDWWKIWIDRAAALDAAARRPSRGPPGGRHGRQ